MSNEYLVKACANIAICGVVKCITMHYFYCEVGRTVANYYFCDMRRIVRISLFVLICCLTALDATGATPNVVIEQLDNLYRFVPAKGGDRLEKVEVTEQATFRANRSEDVAVAIGYYSDDVKLVKATGGTVTYGPLYDDDVFFNDSKGVLVSARLKKAGATAKTVIQTAYTKPEFFTTVYLFEPYDVESARYTFEVPASMDTRFEFEPRNIPADKIEHTVERKGSNVLHIFTMKDVPQMKHFGDAPSRNVSGPQIVVKGHFADVNDLYGYLRSYLDDSDPGAATVAAKAQELTAGCATDAEKIAAIADFVHKNIRYVAVEHGDYGHRPDIPSEVLRKLYGDCKGSASLLVAMYNAVGLDARRVWIGTTSVADNWTDNPSLSCGNHMIAAVMLPDSIVYVDGTAAAILPPGLPSGIQGREALIEDGPDRCITAMVPLLPAEANRYESSYDVTISSDGTLSADGTMRLTGAPAYAVATILNSTAPAKHDKILRSLLMKELGGVEAQVRTIERSGAEVSLSGTVDNFSRVKKVGDEMYVELNPIPGLADFKFDTKERTEPGYVDKNIMLDQSLTLMLPDGFTVGEQPADVSVSNKYFEGNVTGSLSDDGHSITRRVVVVFRRGIVPLDEVKSYNADLMRLVRSAAASVILRPQQ